MNDKPVDLINDIIKESENSTGTEIILPRQIIDITSGILEIFEKYGSKG